MLMTKNKILATIVATTLCISTIMPSVALALDTVEPTAPTTVETTETEPAVSEKPIVKETEATTETTVEPSEESSETTASEDKNVEETQSSETTPKDINESDKDSTPTTSETTAETEATEPTESKESEVDTSEAEPTAFNQSVTVDGIKITVEADPGVFPEGAELKARKINKVAINKEDNIVSSMTFDICIYLGDKEIEPDTTKGNVKVTFFDERFEDKNLDAAIYHTTDDKKTVEMDYDVVDGGAQTKTDGFSLYTVEFTYADMQYVLTGNSSVALSTILKAVGLEGDVTDVTFSNDSLIKYEDGNIFALKAFTSTEWMKVTINGITYIITVTDNPEVPEDATAGTDAYAILYSSGALVFQKGNDQIQAYGTKQQEWLIPTVFADNPDTTDVDESLPSWLAYAENINKIVFVDNIKGIISLKDYFKGLENVATVSNIDRLDISTVTSLNNMFYGCSSITTLDLSSWNTTNVQNMSAIFYGCTSLKTLSLSGWNFRGLANSGSTGGAFSNCSALKTLDLSNVKMPVDTNNVGLCLGWHMSGTAFTLDTLDVSNIDLSQTTSLYGFLTCKAKNIIGLTTWDVSGVASISSLFNGNSVIESIDISGWDLRNMTNTYGTSIFACSNLKSLNLSNVKMPADTAASKFQLGWGNTSVSYLETLNVTNIDLSSTTCLRGFLTVPAKNIIGLDTWDTSHVKDFTNLFSGQKYITELDLSNFTFTSVDAVMYMCADMSKLAKIILPESYNNLQIREDNHLALNYVWTNVATNATVTAEELTVAGTYELRLDPDTAYADVNAYAILTSKGTLIFQNSDELADTTYGTVVETWEVDTSNHPWTGDAYRDSVKKVIFNNKLVGRTYTSYMFCNLANLTTLTNLGYLDTSNVTSMYEMFYDSPKIISIDVSEWDTSKVTNFGWMFGCDDYSASDSSLKEIIGVENLVTSSATSIYCMFYQCKNLTELDVSAWDISNVTDISWTFTRTKIKKLDLRNWNFSKVTDATNFVLGNVNLRTVVLPESYGNLPIDKRAVGFMGNWESITTGAKYTGTQMNNLMPAVTDTYHAIATAGDNAYAILYNSGKMVFQLGNIPEEDYGSVIGTYLVKPSYDGAWTSEKTKINEVIFKDEIVGVLDMSNGNGGYNNTNTWFGNCSTLISVKNADKLDTSKVTEVFNLFANCTILETVQGTEAWTLENCTDFARMFYLCPNLKSIDLSNVNSSKGTTFYRMFENCKSLEVVDLSNWDFSYATSCDAVFAQLNANSKLYKIILPDSATVFNPENFGLKGISTYWVKNGTEKVSYSATNAGGTYELLVNEVIFKPTTNTEDYVTFYITKDTPTYNIPDNLLNMPANNGHEFLGWADKTGKLFEGTVIDKNTPNELLPKYEYEPQTAVYGTDLYVMVYQNGTENTLVYQKGNEPDPDYGTFIGSTLATTVNSKPALYIGQVKVNNKTYNGDRIVIKDRLTNLPAVSLQLYTYGTSNTTDTYCENLELIDLTNINHIQLTFKGNSSNSTGSVYGLAGMAQWNTSTVTSLYLFVAEEDLTHTDIPDLSNWNTSNVTNMSYAFECAKGDMSFAKNWNTSSVETMTHIFDETQLDKLEVANWNTENVKDLSYAFRKYNGLTDISEISNWNTENVDNMSYLFYFSNSGNISSIKNWNLSSCTNLAYAFAENTNFGGKAFDIIKDWDVSNVMNFEGIFMNDTGLAEAELNWNFENAKNMSSMFNGCTKLTKFTGNAQWTPKQDSNTMANLFYNCKNLVDVSGVATWNTSNVVDLSGAFYYCKLPNLNALANWDVSKVVNMNSTFHSNLYSSEAALYDISALANWNTASLQSLNSTFAENSRLYSLDGLETWDVSNVTSMQSTFYYCTNIKSIEPLSGWHPTNKLTTIYNMFYQCSNVSSLHGLENWDVSGVTTMQGAFQGMRKLSDASAIYSWNTSSLTNYNYMFNGCVSLPEMNFANWDLSHLTHANNISTYDSGGRAKQSAGVFTNCNSLLKITFPENFTINTAANYSNATGSYFYATDAWMYDRNSGSGSSGPLSGDWIFEPTGEVVKLHDEILPNFTAANAGTYYKEYDVVLYPMGGKLDNNKIHRSVLDPITELPTPTRDNYTFLGWYNSNGEKVESIAAGEYVASLFAKWEAEGYYTLILDPNFEGIDPIQVRLAPDELYNVNSNVFSGIPSEYEFLYWTERKTNAGSKFADGAEISHLGEIDDTVYLYAQWISHKTIPVNLHLVNIVTGETVDNGQINVTLNTTSTKDTLYNAFKNANPDDVQSYRYCAYNSGLDAVHFDYNENDIVTLNWKYSMSVYKDQFGHTYDHTEYYDQNLIKIEKSGYINWTSHTWVASDYNKDIYVYYMPAIRFKVYFSAQQEEWFPVDELIMTVDGKEYRSGEYEITVPWTYNDGGMDFYSSYADDNGNSVQTCYTPDWYISAKWYAELYSTAEKIESKLCQTGYSFNYPAYIYQASGFKSYPGGPDIFPTLDEQLAGNLDRKGVSETYHYQDSNAVGEIVLGLSNLDLVYDTNCTDSKFNNNSTEYQQYMVHFTQLGWQGGSNKAYRTYPVNYTPTRAGYKFDGWWTAPEGGTQILRPGENYSSTGPHDLTECPVVEYALGVISSDNPHCYMNNRNSFSSYLGYNSVTGQSEYKYVYSTDLTNNRFVTVYAHWIPEDEWVNPYPGTDFDPNTDHEFVLLTLHNSHADPAITQHKYDAPFRLWMDEFDIPDSQKDSSKYEDYLFMGWYTEPNGQGTLVYNVKMDGRPQGAMNITMQPGTADLYAYWAKPTNKIYFDPYGDEIHPNNVKVAFSQTNYANAYNDSITPAYIVCSDKITSYSIPFAITSENYEFLGWFDENGNKVQVGDTAVNGAVYTAHWKNHGNADSSINYNLGFTTGSAIYEMPTYSTRYMPTELSFEISMADDIVLPAGAVKIFIPDSDILNYNDITTYTNIEEGKYFKYSYLSEYNEEDRPYLQYGGAVITNGTAITGTVAFMTQKSVDARYDLGMRDVDGYDYLRDGYDKIAKIYQSKPVILMIDKDLDGTPEVVEYKYVYMQSKAYIGAPPTSFFDNIYVEGKLKTYFGNNDTPDDLDEYYYVQWHLTSYDYNASTSRYNENLLFYYDVIPNQGGILVSSNKTEYNGEMHDGYYDDHIVGYYDFIVKYPKDQFNYNAQRAIITQSVDILLHPLYEWRNTGGQEDRTIKRIGSVTINWAEGEMISTGDEVWANMGRVSGDEFVSLGNSTNSISKQRQLAYKGQNVPGFSWFAVYAEDNTRSRRASTEVSIQPGYFSYVSGADPEYWMYNPVTGRQFLAENDYCITGYTWYFYNGSKSGSSSVGITRDKPVNVYIKHRGSDEWELYYSGTGSESSKVYNDGHLNLIFNRQQGKTFGNASDVVAISVRADYDDNSNYQVICVVPKITLLNTAKTKSFAKADFDQEVASTIAMNDFRINGHDNSGVSYISGDWGLNLIWDEDLGLCTWHLTSDAVPLCETNTLISFGSKTYAYYTGRTWNEGDAELDGQIVNQTTQYSDSYFVPIDSGIYYTLLPEGATLEKYNAFVVSTTSPGASVLYRSDLSGQNNRWHRYTSYWTTISPEHVTLEVIDNWENSGRTMLKYTFSDLTSILGKNTETNALCVVMNIERDETNLAIYGYSGTSASMFINTTGTPYASRKNAYSNYNDTSLVKQYFSNLNAENASKSNSIAYSTSNVTFYTPNPISTDPSVSHQNGFNEFMANSNNKYSNGAKVFPGETYTYKVYWSQADTKAVNDGTGTYVQQSTKTDSLIMYTKLDGVGQLVKTQIPTIKGKVYTSETEFEEVTVTPTVWYCIDSDFANINNTTFKSMDLSTIDLTDTTKWTTTMPDDGKVYGMVFDYSKDDQGRTVSYELDKYININLYMKNTATEPQTFTSSSRMIATGFSMGDDVYGGNMLGEVVLPDLDIDVITKPTTGTVDSPAPVRFEQDLTYIWKVKNNEDRTIENIVVTFNVPDGTACTLNKIIAGNAPISENINIKDISLENGKVTLTIKQLATGATFTITENAYVSTGENNFVITNQGAIIGYNDITPSVTQLDSMKSDITYHITQLIPDPTGFNTAILPYVFVLGTFGAVGYYVAKKKKKEQFE